jgi:hypothetical protein
VANAWFEDALNQDPNNPGIKFLVDRCHGQQHLVVSPAFDDAITRGINTYHPADDPAVEHVAVRKLWKPEGLLVLPKDSDIELLFPDLNQDEQIRNGLALPEKDEPLNDTLKEHPELKPQLLAAWKNACVEREQGESASMAAAIRQLTTTASRLGLPAGHFEEALAKDPRLKAQWQAAIEKAGNEEFFGETDAALTAIGQFGDTVQRLRESASHPQNSSNPYELK